jgi:hypothetical protein
MNKLTFAFSSVLFLTACGPKPTQNMKELPEIQNDSTVEVVRIGVFKDGIAYNDRRGIYRIKDRQTGKEYLGISGIGVVETGSHSCGKSCTTRDER